MLKLNSLHTLCAFKFCLWRLPNQIMVKCIRFQTLSSPVPNSVSFSAFYNILRNSSIQLTKFQVSSGKELANKLGVEYDSILHSLQKCPELLNVSPLHWENCFRELMNNGFTAEDSLYMVTKYPPLLRLNAKDLSLVFRYWRGTNMGEKYVLSLLRTFPKFLFVPGTEISIRVGHLKTLGASKGVVILLKGAPNLMFENWEDVVAKLSFLQDEMRVDKKHILKSFALNRSLLFLKTRFVFLLRCGVYVKPKLDPDRNIQSKNPTLKSIAETNNEKFATQVARVTLEEYEVFEELYAMEAEDEDDEISD